AASFAGSLANPSQGGDAKPPVCRSLRPLQIAGLPGAQCAPVSSALCLAIRSTCGKALPMEIGMRFRNWRVALTAGVASFALAGCLPESQIAAPLTPAPAEDPPNQAPLISGIPLTAAIADTAWEFEPVAIDADGDVLSFRAT